MFYIGNFKKAKNLITASITVGNKFMTTKLFGPVYQSDLIIVVHNLGVKPTRGHRMINSGENKNNKPYILLQN